MSNIIEMWNNVGLWKGIADTLIMVGLSTILSYLIGVPLGLVLTVTEKGGIKENQVVYNIVSTIVNIGRSIPFIILLVAMIPFTRLVMGTSIGVKGMIVPLTIGCIPYIARITETNMKEVDRGVVDAAVCMGATTYQVVTKVYLVESLPSMVRSISITMVMLVGYSAMSGAVGGNGIGAIAIEYGYYMSERNVMLLIIVVIIILVQLIQMIFSILGRIVDKKGAK